MTIWLTTNDDEPLISNASWRIHRHRPRKNVAGLWYSAGYVSIFAEDLGVFERVLGVRFPSAGGVAKYLIKRSAELAKAPA